MIKKYILGFLLILSVPTVAVLAATPLLTASATGDGNNVRVNVSGADVRAPVVLYFTSSAYGTMQSSALGITDDNGYYSGTVNTSSLSIGNSNPVYVMVNGYQSGSVTWPYNATSTTGGVYFSQTSPNVAVGQTGTLTIYGGNGSYYVSSNSNAGVVGTSISGNTLTLSGLANGQSNVMVCSNSGGCGTFTVTSSGSTYGGPNLSQSTLTFNQGGQDSVTISGGTSPYTISVPAGSGITTNLTGNTLYVNGVTMGTNIINVCSTGGGCTPLSVNVQSQTGTGNGGQLSFFLPLSVGETVHLGLSGGIGNYYLQSSMSSPALAILSGSNLNISGQTTGSGVVTVCQTGGTSCLPINVSVGPALTGTGGGYLFETDLYTGLSGQNVMELQNRLKSEGYFSATATGYFGPITYASVQQYQTAHGISSTGYVGLLTRAELNK